MRLCVGVCVWGVRVFVYVCRMQARREGRDERAPEPSVIASLSTARPWSEHQLESPGRAPIARGDEGEELRDIPWG